MKYTPFPLLFAVLSLGQSYSQEVTAPTAAPSAIAATIPVFQVLSETTVQQRDGSSITFRQVVPPVVTPPQVPPATPVPVPALTAAEEDAVSQMPVKETTMLSISASVQADGFTVLRWTCGASQRLHAVSNIDFRALTGLGSLETEQASYFLILSAGPTNEMLSDAEARAAQLLPVNGRASFALVGGSAVASQSDELALNAIESLLEFFDANREELVQQLVQREAENAARQLAALNAPPPPPRHSIVHFWPLQPAQRAAIAAQVQREAALKAAAQPAAQSVKGAAQP